MVLYFDDDLVEEINSYQRASSNATALETTNRTAGGLADVTEEYARREQQTG
jgi:hypothetical protein